MERAAVAPGSQLKNLQVAPKASMARSYLESYEFIAISYLY
jgi:hypothetical protein